MYSTGYQYFTPSLPFAIATGEHLYDLYNNLPNRKKSVEVVSKRECITADSSDHPLHQELKIPSTLKYRFISTTTSTSSAATTMENTNKSIKINKILHKFTTLISTQGKSIRLVSKNTWINGIRKLMLDSNPSPEYRSVHILEYLLNELIHRWIYCRQLSILVSLYTFGCVSHSAYGSYRVELIISLFDRIVDLHNFQFVIMMLSSEEYACLLARIGKFAYFIFFLLYLCDFIIYLRLELLYYTISLITTTTTSNTTTTVLLLLLYCYFYCYYRHSERVQPLLSLRRPAVGYVPVG